MNPLTHLIVASLAFLATHYVASTPLRDVLVSTMGKAYLALYSLIAFATLGWMIWAFYHAPFVNLWYAEAGASEGFPLDDRSALEILVSERPQLSSPRNRYVYFPNHALQKRLIALTVTTEEPHHAWA